MTQYICNAIQLGNFSEHCLKCCFHGQPHEKDECTRQEFCNLSTGKKILRVKCVPMTNKLMKIWENKYGRS
jgi:hypothetical protein